jgi:hypothetical protein
MVLPPKHYAGATWLFEQLVNDDPLAGNVNAAVRTKIRHRGPRVREILSKQRPETPTTNEVDTMIANAMRLISIAFLGIFVFVISESASCAEDYKISGPFAHENLAVYFVHGPSQADPVPKTLREAADNNLIGVTETRKVNQLIVENRGDTEIFLQAGEVVKGGDQDRVVGVSAILPPHSGPTPIVAFCIERGRWSARAGENHDTLSAGGRSVPPGTAKQFLSGAISAYFGALIAANPGGAPTDPSQTTNAPQVSAAEARSTKQALERLSAEVSQAQAQTWSEADRMQVELSRRLRASVSNPRSPTSLALTLDDKHLQAAEDGFVTALQSHGMEDNDVIGYVLAVDGRIDSAQIYSSNELFRKMWAQSLRAGADEAIAADHSSNNALPSLDEVHSFIADSKGAVAKTVTANEAQEITNEPGKTMIQTGRAGGAWIERTYHAIH